MQGEYMRYRFGTLSLDGKPQKNPQNPVHDGDIPVYDDKAAISIGDTVPGMEINWIQPEGTGVLVSDRVILSGVSWAQLNAMRLTHGKEICIDGRQYKCRLLRVGSKKGDVNEWDDCLDKTHSDDNLWHWQGVMFWGQDEFQEFEEKSSRAVRGFAEARQFDRYKQNSATAFVGFRPVLEPMGNLPAPVGKEIILDGQRFLVVLGDLGVVKCVVPRLLALSDDGSCDYTVFSSMPEHESKPMYSLLMDGEPVEQETGPAAEYKPGAKLEFSDTFYGEQYLIPWTFKDGIAYADRVILCDIDEETLRAQGFL